MTATKTIPVSPMIFAGATPATEFVLKGCKMKSAASLLNQALRVSTTLVCLVLSSYPIAAQPTPRQSGAQVLQSAQEDARTLEQLRVALEGQDLTTKITTFNAMIGSGNPAFVEMAINEGAASSVPQMRTLALRAAFDQVKEVVFELDSGGQTPDPAVQQYLLNYANFRITKYDPASGVVDLFGHGVGRGQISADLITFRLPFCSGTLNNVKGTWRFAGLVTCVPDASTKGFSGRLAFTMR